MKNWFFLKIFIFSVLCFHVSGTLFFLCLTQASGVKTSYKRYSIFKYQNDDVLCESYIVNKDDWLYKIFRKKGEISEKDFPLFLTIFKAMNPQISNIDAIESGMSILIPLKKVKKEDYDQSITGNIDIPVVEFSIPSEAVDLKSFVQKHKIKKGENISTLIDKVFLKKGGALSEEGLKAVQLANPDIKNIDIVYEGANIYLPDISITSQPWFQSFFSGKPQQQEKSKKQTITEPFKMEPYKLEQLQRYASLIGGTLLSHGQIFFPGKNRSPQVLDLSVMPLIETKEGFKILIIADENVNAELLKSVKTYWKNLTFQLMSEIIDRQENAAGINPLTKTSVTAEYKKMIQVLLSQTNYDYVPNEKIPFALNNIHLEASFGRIIRKNNSDLLINFGAVYGSALAVFKKKKFEIISITSQLTPIELVGTLFSNLGYSTWDNPSFFTGETVESIKGLYATQEQDKLFIPLDVLSNTAINYLKKENIKILSTRHKTSVQ